MPAATAFALFYIRPGAAFTAAKVWKIGKVKDLHEKQHKINDKRPPQCII
jgi:hypothetical protein